MKLKCNHDRRVMVLESGKTIHRNDGSRCFGNSNMLACPSLTMGGKKVTKRYTTHSLPGIPVGTCHLDTDLDSSEKLLKEIFEVDAELAQCTDWEQEQYINVTRLGEVK